MAADSAGLDSGCGRRTGFIKEELGTFFANADPAGFSHSSGFCTGKDQDVPREEKRKIRASSKEYLCLCLSYGQTCVFISFLRPFG
jgi:hypothetical protein